MTTRKRGTLTPTRRVSEGHNPLLAGFGTEAEQSTNPKRKRAIQPISGQFPAHLATLLRQERFALLCAKLFCKSSQASNLLVKLLLVVIVIGECTVYLAERQLRMPPLQLFGTRA